MSRLAHYALSGRPPRRTSIRVVAGAVAIVAAAGTMSPAQPQPGSDDKGKARLVERRGPEVEIRPNGVGQVIVLFPQSSSPEKNVVELTMVESQLPAPPQPGQPPTGAATPTGREFVFSSKDARDQTVSYKLDASGNGRKFMLLAKLDGKVTEVRPVGGPEGVQTFLVTMPDAPKPPEPAAAPPAADGQPAAPPPPAPPAIPAQAAVVVIYTGSVAP